MVVISLCSLLINNDLATFYITLNCLCGKRHYCIGQYDEDQSHQQGTTACGSLGSVRYGGKERQFKMEADEGYQLINLRARRELVGALPGAKFEECNWAHAPL